MALVTCSTASGWKSTNVQPDGADENDGRGALAMNARTSATFASIVGDTPWLDPGPA